MKKQGKTTTTRKPPEPSADHTVIDDWIRRVMPELNPIVRYLDERIRDSATGMQYAVKWKQAYYFVPERGWVIELAAYDVSVNVVFLGGSDFDDPPALGSGMSRYVKVRTLEEAKAPEIGEWIDEAVRMPGWM